MGLNFERGSSSPLRCDAAGWGDFPVTPDLGAARTARAAADPALLEEPPILLHIWQTKKVQRDEGEFQHRGTHNIQGATTQLPRSDPSMPPSTRQGEGVFACGRCVLRTPALASFLCVLHARLFVSGSECPACPPPGVNGILVVGGCGSVIRRKSILVSRG